eukprot:Clim_evm51s128 gene=Clim_evmTU51s128
MAAPYKVCYVALTVGSDAASAVSKQELTRTEQDLTDLIARPDSKGIEIIPCDQWHLSLTRRLQCPLSKLHRLRSLVESVRKDLKLARNLVVILGPTVRIYGADIDSSAVDAIDHFLAFPLVGQRVLEDFDKAVDMLDNGLEGLDLPRFNEDREFHISFAKTHDQDAGQRLLQSVPAILPSGGLKLKVIDLELFTN